jgi:hypothetical protein
MAGELAGAHRISVMRAHLPASALGLNLLEVRQIEPDRGSPEPGDGCSP